MKKSVLATAVLATLVSGSTLAATVYKADGTEFKVGGRVEFRGDFNAETNGQEIDGTMSDQTRARLNLKGSSEISDGVKAFAFYEVEQKANDSDEKMKNRYMYAGVDMHGNALSFGAQDMASVQISKFSDIGAFTGLQKPIAASKDHTEGVIAYRGDFDALNVQATYKAESTDDSDSYGVSGTYSLPVGVKLGLAYSADQDKVAGNATSTDKGNQILAGISYSMDALYLAATYSTGDTGNGDDEFDIMEFAAAYDITDQVQVQAIYGKDTTKPETGADVDNEDFVELGGYYKFNSNLKSYIAYKANSADGADDDTIRLGLKYGF
ncbi:porin [Vibrio palustris]|uniref:Porin-like protein L n=1 Tax=Vibrio palustris TaxID=1918946 RepID=A0A1R4B6C2_9VIBR|nr:porin [Vibrio palustris]SJL84421.1 Porin-like protein L precursor [Vibrio palustris]